MKSTLKVVPISTALYSSEKDLESFIIESLKDYPVKEKSVLAVTSKIFSLAENRQVFESDKEKLVHQEADYYLAQSHYGHHLTIKEGVILSSAGIDQSNSPTGDYLLLPKNPYLSLKNLWQNLKIEWKLKTLGLLMTDSHTTPLRRGVTGVALAHWGFEAVTDCRGDLDLYDRELQVTTVNNNDALSTMAVWMMGEGKEKCPLVMIENANLKWTNESSSEEIRIPLEEDLYRVLLESRIKNRK